jgi:hypothetical protein
MSTGQRLVVKNRGVGASGAVCSQGAIGLLDLTGWTVEELIHEDPAIRGQCKAETKLIRFPTPVHGAYKTKVK